LAGKVKIVAGLGGLQTRHPQVACTGAGEGLGALIFFGFEGFSGGEFAFNVGCRPQGTGLEQALLASGNTTCGTGDGRYLFRRQVFQSHFGRVL